MYSVVLATMLAAGSTTPDWGHHQRYSGCYGCHGYSNAYSCSGCYGSCYGGSCHGGYARYSGCYGCGGCYSGYSSYSCGGGCYGGYSGYSGYSCGGCYGSSCYGGCCGGSVVYSSCYGGSGCCGGVVYAPAPVVTYPVAPVVVPVAPMVVPVPFAPAKVLVPVNPYQVQSQPVAIPTAQLPTSPAPARVTVLLPPDARLWVDQVECPLSSGVRSFTTPALNANQQYFYTLRVEMARDGRVVTDNQRVLLTPGQETRVDFNGASAQRTVAR